MTSEEMANKLGAAFPSAIIETNRFREETTLRVQASALRDICLHARDNLGFNYLIDISAVDHFGKEPRYEVVYELYSLKDCVHLRLKTDVSEDDCRISTVSDIWPTADWHEREAYDMMGIRFTDHPDLRRILMWDGYPYHPLRKDFPLEGKPSELPGVAFTEPAPLAGGPFVTVPTDGTTQVREPRARHAGDLVPPETFLAEP
ncbi:MAG: NADH-quinone oxidoreductase subunit C [bacterium]